MIYLKWKLSDGHTGTGPEEVIADRGGHAEAAWGSSMLMPASAPMAAFSDHYPLQNNGRTDRYSPR